MRITLQFAARCFLAIAFCSTVAAAYEARLVGGKAVYNELNEISGYLVYAESGAVANPSPQFAIFQGNTQINSLYSAVHETNSNMTWSTVSFPFGGSNATGTSPVYATSSNRFVLNDLVFPFHGRYNLKFTVHMNSGQTVVFNRTIVVDPQPAQIVMLEMPSGYNGTVFTYPAIAQIQDFLGNPSRTTTPVVTFVVSSGPGAVTGTYIVRPESDGSVKMAKVILTQPGRYLCRLVASLSDNSQISTPTFQLDIARALPIDILILSQASGAARTTFFTNPQYRIVDTVGFAQDSRTNITLRLGYNVPTINYQGQDTVAHLSGTISKVQSGFDYIFDGLSIDLPGRFEIVATLYLDGDVFMEKSHTINIADQPTFSVPGLLTVNTISTITLLGYQPKIQPLYLKVSSDVECVTSGSDIAPWPQESNPILQIRNFSFVPFTSGAGKYLCILIPTMSNFIPLLLAYEPAFNEPYPLDYTFSIFGVSTCRDLTLNDEFLYRTAGWTTATVNRAYGCNLQPPVSGTIAPCDCFFSQTCVPFTHESFTPPFLDIGLCECCKPWVLALAAIFSSGLMIGLLAVVYYFV